VFLTETAEKYSYAIAQKHESSLKTDFIFFSLFQLEDEKPRSKFQVLVVWLLSRQ
jgi:hypothetical protein